MKARGTIFSRKLVKTNEWWQLSGEPQPRRERKVGAGWQEWGAGAEVTPPLCSCSPPFPSPAPSFPCNNKDRVSFAGKHTNSHLTRCSAVFTQRQAGCVLMSPKLALISLCTLLAGKGFEPRERWPRFPCGVEAAKKWGGNQSRSRSRQRGILLSFGKPRAKRGCQRLQFGWVGHVQKQGWGGGCGAGSQPSRREANPRLAQKRRVWGLLKLPCWSTEIFTPFKSISR